MCACVRACVRTYVHVCVGGGGAVVDDKFCMLILYANLP